MPVYKHEAYLMEAVHSILSQTFTDFELIILSDDPGYVYLDYQDLDNRIEVYDKINSGELTFQNKGKWYRIKQGFGLAKGQFIAFQDADDVSIPQRFELSLKNIGDADFLYSDAISMNKDGTHSYLRCQDLEIENRPLGNQGSYFFRKVISIKYPEIGRGDDWLFVAECFKKGFKFKYLPLPLYYYRDYSGNFRANSNKIKRYFSNRKLRKIVNQITQSTSC